MLIRPAGNSAIRDSDGEIVRPKHATLNVQFLVSTIATGGIYRSFTGKNWTQVRLPESVIINGMVFQMSRKLWGQMATDDAIYLSRDGLKSMEFFRAGSFAGQEFIPSDPVISLPNFIEYKQFLPREIRVNASSDDGVTWSNTFSLSLEELARGFGFRAFPNGVRLFAIETTPGGTIYRSTDGGFTWTSLTNVFSTAFTQDFLFSNSSIEPRNGFIVTANQRTGAQARLLISLDYGATWNSLNLSLPGAYLWSAVNAQDPDGNFIAVATRPSQPVRLYFSVDFGVNWLLASVPPPEFVISMVRLKNGSFLAYVPTGSVYLSTDQGDTWVDTGESGALLGLLFNKKAVAYEVVPDSIKITKDGESFKEVIPNVDVSSLWLSQKL